MLARCLYRSRHGRPPDLMSPFRKPRLIRAFAFRTLKIAAFALLLTPALFGLAAAAEPPDPFAHPPALEKDVRFWIRVYTEVTTDQGLLHDDWNLGLVYEVLRFDPASSPAQRERRVAEAKARYAALLKRFAAGSTDDLTPHERRILHAFGDHPTPQDFRDAIDRIRFQLGQADRFHEGLIRAAVWEKQIARTLAAAWSAGRNRSASRTSSPRSIWRRIRRSAPPGCGNSCRPPPGDTCASTAWSTSVWTRTAPRRPRRI